CRYPARSSTPLRGKGRHALDFIRRESAGFLAGLWETMPWCWMNRPSTLDIAANKLVQLDRARSAGLPVPGTLVTNDPRAARAFVAAGATIVKPVVSGGLPASRRSLRAVYTTQVTRDDLRDDAAVSAAPAIYQRRVPNAFDLRVTVVGALVFAT